MNAEQQAAAIVIAASTAAHERLVEVVQIMHLSCRRPRRHQSTGSEAASTDEEFPRRIFGQFSVHLLYRVGAAQTIASEVAIAVNAAMRAREDAHGIGVASAAAAINGCVRSFERLVAVLNARVAVARAEAVARHGAAAGEPYVPLSAAEIDKVVEVFVNYFLADPHTAAPAIAHAGSPYTAVVTTSLMRLHPAPETISTAATIAACAVMPAPAEVPAAEAGTADA